MELWFTSCDAHRPPHPSIQHHSTAFMPLNADGLLFLPRYSLSLVSAPQKSVWSPIQASHPHPLITSVPLYLCTPNIPHFPIVLPERWECAGAWFNLAASHP